MFLSAGVSLANNSDSSFLPLLLSACITAVVGFFPLIFVPADSQMSLKEIYCIVLFAWVGCCLFGMLPYVLYGDPFTVTNAWFESVSGFTTTGATILNSVETLPKGILFWRSCTHLAGGVGVVMFALIVLPSFGANKMKLSKIEMSQLAQDDFKFKSQQTIRVVLSVYVGLTIASTVSLFLAGMNLFDAVCHAFSTIATGGFSTRDASIAAYSSGWIELVVIIFMVLSGLHFGMIYSSVTGRSFFLFRSSVVRFYLLFLLVGALFIALNLLFTNHYATFGESFRKAIFQIVALTTTSGFATADTSVWPPFSILILLYAMFQCACAGSTAGGVKVNRIVILFKAIGAQIRKQQHPNAVVPVRVDGVRVEDDTVSSVLLFIVFFLLIVFVSTILMTLMGLNLLSGFSVSLSAMSNVGPGFDIFNSFTSWNTIPAAGKFILSIVMLIGRLEIYGLLLLFYIRSWR